MVNSSCCNNFGISESSCFNCLTLNDQRACLQAFIYDSKLISFKALPMLIANDVPVTVKLILTLFDAYEMKRTVLPICCCTHMKRTKKLDVRYTYMANVY